MNYYPIKSVRELENKIFIISVEAPDIAANAYPGQFCNIKVTESIFPLLRRPFSICDVSGNEVFFMFNVFGEGTKMLSCKSLGDKLNILGPLGNGFDCHGDYETAVMVGGGLGAAPFPYLTRALKNRKEILTFIGGRTKTDVITYGMDNIKISTDDGSLGFHGNVVQSLTANLSLLKKNKIKVFACGPNAMLRALKTFCIDNKFECELSTESAMACGFGICQGCPVQAADKDGYYLVCKDGPVFDARKIII